jgi:8-oxo-dGTP diphosphatase
MNAFNKEISSDKIEVIEAAGGVLWRGRLEEPEVAIIHRLRYDDWTLPKGKREAGETWTETALREVFEETGCKARLGKFAGGVIYTVKDTPKIVLFWHMRVAEDLGFQPNPEVDQLVWVPTERAQEIMSYPDEIALLWVGT